LSSTYDAFDIDETSSVARPEKPLWKLIQDKASDDEIHKWCQGELSYLDQENRERLRVIQRNLARYKGLQYLSQEIRERIRDLGDEVNARKVQKIVDQIKIKISAAKEFQKDRIPSFP
jgi:mRNA-degrading endonuclease RelE of RelBE toxin-antitoxin system